jgi:N-methylhydantoinase B
MSIADRSILACWGVKGGRAGRPFEVVIDPDGPNEREVDALADAEPIKAGETVRIRTTGGGGWGDPLERDPSLVVRDVVWRKVSPSSALEDYGVVPQRVVVEQAGEHDARATAARRASVSEERGTEAFFDRGPGFRRLGGADAAEVDWL